MKHTLFILALITATIQTFAQSPRIKLNQITKDSVTGSVLISSPTDSGMVYSRDLFISYGADTFLILGEDTIILQSDLIAEIGDSLVNYVSRTELSDSTTNIRTDIPLIIADSLLNYVTIAGTQTITGNVTFTSDVEIDGKLNISDANLNVLTGDGSGESISTGNNNTALGYDAGRYIDGGGNNTDSDNSVFIGYNTRPLADAQTNQIVIGYDAIGLGSNSVVLGNGSITKTRLQGDVGIGTDSPSADLDVVGDVEVNGNLTVTGTINNEPTHKQISLGEGYADNIRKFYYDSSITVHPSNLGYSYAELIKEDLLKEASLIVTPTATSVGKLYTQKPLGITDAFDVVRNSTSTRVNSLGLIETVPDSVPRIDYTDGEPSLLLEPSRTNLLTYSEDFSDAAWVKDNSSTTANTAISPDGTTNADKLVEDSANNFHRLRRFVVTISNSTNYSFYIFAKADERNFVVIRSDIEGSNRNATFNLSTGDITFNGFVGSAFIEDFDDGWYKCGVNVNSGDTSATLSYCLSDADVTDNNIPSYTGDGTSGIYFWGAQLEEGSYATSYIPTNGSTVTRAADDVELTGGADLIGDSEGTLFVEFLSFENQGSPLAISDGSFSNVAQVNLGASMTARIRSGNSLQSAISTSWNLNQFYKTSLVYKTNDAIFYVDGLEIGSDTTVTTYSEGTLNLINFNGSVTSTPFYGRIRQLEIFPTALTDSELEALTQP